MTSAVPGPAFSVVIPTVGRPSLRTLLDAGQNVAGYVRLAVRGLPGDTVTVTSRTRGTHAQIEISDSGPGIAADGCAAA